MGSTLWDFYLSLSQKIADGALADVKSLDAWKARRGRLYDEFMRSMGLDPLPPRDDLAVEGRGEFRGAGYRATRLAYQILPDCWATAVFYLPDPLPTERLPAVLYVCGHMLIGSHGYQDHAAMWARRGYACLIVDTIEQHDNPADHHGLYYGYRPDWVSMGYTGAGGELWNSIRALDLLSARPEVDPARIGVTGNSGGGALSFFLGAADARVRAVATACGVAAPNFTLAHRHLMNHCDCVYAHNPYQRDTSEFAALIAPRPVLFCFAREDVLFSPEEFRGMVARTQRVYRLYGRENVCRLFEYEGPHGYRPKTVEAINRWFDEHVSGRPHPLLSREKPDQPESSFSVFNGNPPSTNHLALLPELLSPRGGVELPRSKEDWPTVRAAAVGTLRREVLHVLDAARESADAKCLGCWLSGETRLERYLIRTGGMDVWAQKTMPPKASGPVLVRVANTDENAEQVIRWFGRSGINAGFVAVEPRGTGFTGNGPSQTTHLLRAGAITGLTPTMLMIQDIRTVVQLLRRLPDMEGRRVVLCGRGDAGVACLYAAVLDEDIAAVAVEDIPTSHRRGAPILGILRVMDIDHALGLMAPRPLAVAGWHVRPPMWARRAYDRLGGADHLDLAAPTLSHAAARVLGRDEVLARQMDKP